MKVCWKVSFITQCELSIHVGVLHAVGLLQLLHLSVHIPRSSN